ncbi:hypothetical protein GQ457_11G015190 [Hibiscus cannabinus]
MLPRINDEANIRSHWRNLGCTLDTPVTDFQAFAYCIVQSNMMNRASGARLYLSSSDEFLLGGQQQVGFKTGRVQKQVGFKTGRVQNSSGSKQVGFKTGRVKSDLGSGSVATVTGLIRFRVNISRLQIGFGSLQPQVKPGSDSIGFQSGFQVGSAFYIPNVDSCVINNFMTALKESLQDIIYR